MTPLVDLLMVSGEKDRRDATVLVDFWARVLRVLEEAVGEAFDLVRGILIQDAVDETRDRIDHAERRQLTAGQDVIADRDVLDVEDLEGALIDAFIVSAEEQDILFLGELLRHFLIEGAALRRHKEHTGRSMTDPLDDVLVAVDDRLHLHEHAGTAAVRIVIDVVMRILRVVADVEGLDIHQSGLDGTTTDALTDDVFNHLRKEGHHIVVFHSSAFLGIGNHRRTAMFCPPETSLIDL